MATTDSRSLYAGLLGLTPPWQIEDVEMKLKEGEVHIRVALPSGERWVCPECHTAAPIHDPDPHRDSLVHPELERLGLVAPHRHFVRQRREPFALASGEDDGVDGELFEWHRREEFNTEGTEDAENTGTNLGPASRKLKDAP